MQNNPSQFPDRLAHHVGNRIEKGLVQDMNEERLRKQHAKLEVEQQRSRKRSDYEFHDANMSREQVMLKKQHERLENEKIHNKCNSYLTKDRRLSLDNEQKPSAPKSGDAKSRLFDFEKSAPRSRRQLQNSEGPSTSSSQVIGPLATHAMDVEKVEYRDIVDHVAAAKTISDKASSDNDHGVKAKTNLEKQARGRRGSLQSDPSAEVPQQYQRRGSLQADQLPRRGSITSDPPPRRGSLQSDAPLHTQRRGSINADHFPPRRGSLQPDNNAYDHGAGPSQERRASIRRSSINTSIPGTSLDATHVEDADAERLRVLYNKAIETVQNADEALLVDDKNFTTSSRMKQRRLSEPATGSAGLDVTALKELESILNDARLYSSRKPAVEDHSRLDLSSNRAQKKRIEHLEQVLKQLNHGQTHAEIDPAKILQCSYLRLSTSNVETLEEMMRQSGRDPGIHIHTDVTDLDIWKGMKEERTDLKEAREAAASALASAKQERAQRAKRATKT